MSRPQPRLLLDAEVPHEGGSLLLRVPYTPGQTVRALGEAVRERAAAAGAALPPDQPLRLAEASSGALLFDADLVCDVLTAAEGALPKVRVSSRAAQPGGASAPSAPLQQLAALTLSATPAAAAPAGEGAAGKGAAGEGAAGGGGGGARPLQPFQWVACSRKITISEGGRVAVAAGEGGLLVSNAVFQRGILGSAAARIRIASGLSSIYHEIRVGLVAASSLPAPSAAGGEVLTLDDSAMLGEWKGSFGCGSSAAFKDLPTGPITFRHPSDFIEASTGGAAEIDTRGPGFTDLGLFCDFRSPTPASRTTYVTGVGGSFTDPIELTELCSKEEPVFFALQCVDLF